VETFKATVARYTELAKKGNDGDFGKRADRLFPVEKPPFFYAVKRGSALLVTQSGLLVTTKLPALDTADTVIPGLYAVDNASGGFFSNDYPMTVSGLSHVRALVFGRLAGLETAKEA